jgi:predicted TIM-barrel fold metal-dependent hydrolase
MAAEYNPMPANLALMETIKDYPNLKPVWIAMPHHTGEFPAPPDLRALMKHNGIRAVRLAPGPSNANYSLAEWFSGDLFDMLEECRAPVMLAASQIGWNYQVLHDILAAHPRLRLILTDMPYHAGRALYALMDKYPHLYMETIGYKIFGGIEDTCRRFGSGRLIFGSSAPLYSGASAAGMIRYAKISDAEKRAIASENMEKLLEEASL